MEAAASDFNQMAVDGEERVFLHAYHIPAHPHACAFKTFQSPPQDLKNHAGGNEAAVNEEAA